MATPYRVITDIPNAMLFDTCMEALDYFYKRYPTGKVVPVLFKQFPKKKFIAIQIALHGINTWNYLQLDGTFSSIILYKACLRSRPNNILVVGVLDPFAKTYQEVIPNYSENLIEAWFHICTESKVWKHMATACMLDTLHRRK